MVTISSVLIKMVWFDLIKIGQSTKEVNSFLISVWFGPFCKNTFCVNTVP